MRKLTIVLLVVVLLGSISVALIASNTSPPDEANVPNQSERNCIEDFASRSLVDCIHNGDIRWSHTFIGLAPEMSEMATKVLKTQENVEPLLLSALLDKDRFAVAHVLLTYRSHSHFSAGGKVWNGLRVILFADGHVSYEGNDLAQLYQHWEEILQQQKQ